ncbi:MAG: peptidoglycan DD-metalloendopeptidase family protein [Vallitaleaceae bacterium]|nr:peptidoglycan DD-metalloendopeptidase family protein [Vallitaleaceae bacterium]
MGLRTAKHSKHHTVKSNKHITFMMIPDPTKSAKVVKVPKWLRFPFYCLIIAFALGLVVTAKHIADLEYQVASTKYVVLTDSSSLDDKDTRIADLEATNSQHYEKLQTLQLLAIELDEKLQDLENQKTKLDEKINGTEQTVDSQPAEELVVSAADAMINLPSDAQTFMGHYIGEETAIPEDGFDQQIDKITQNIESKLNVVEQNSEAYINLDQQLDELIPYWDAYPTGSPLSYTETSSSYGWRRDPINGRNAYHTGLDLEARYVPVYATGKGVVESAEYMSGYGNAVIIDHGYGYKTMYAHLSKFAVEPGDTVNRGDQVAVSGATGRVTGAHLHYEVLYLGETQDPLDYIY